MVSHSRKTNITNSSGQDQISVISKRNVKVNSTTHAKLKEKFDKIERWRQEKEAREEQEGLSSEAQKSSERHQSGSGPGEAVLSAASSRRVVFVTHFVVFLYSVCFFIQTGTLPYLSKQLGADPITFGQLQTAFAVCQLIGGPVYGRLGDRYGEKPVLLLAIVSAFLTYLLTGLSSNLLILFCSRIPSIFMHVMQGSQMLLTRLTNAHDRAGSLARLGFSYGLGMVMGPALGGQVTANIGEKSAALLAASGMLVSMILVYVFVPSMDLKTVSNKKTKASNKQSSAKGEFEKAISLFRSDARYLLFVKVLTGIPLAVFQSMFAVIAMEEYKLPADQNGLLMSYIGILSMVMQGGGVSLITARLADTYTLKFAAFTLALTFYATAWLRSLSDFLFLLIPLVFSLCLVNAIITSTLTKVVPQEDTGSILGLNMAVNSVLRTLSPTVGGWMLASYGFTSLGFLGLVCNVSVLGYIRFVGIDLPID